jgi:hypothetical protein
MNEMINITLDIENQLLLEEIKKVLQRFRIQYHTNLTETHTISEEKRQQRMKFFENYKPVGNKGSYTPTKNGFYEL